MNIIKEFADDAVWYVPRVLLLILIMITMPIWIMPYGIYKWLKEQKPVKEVVEKKVEVVPAVVAALDLPWGTKLVPEMLKVASEVLEAIK